MIKNNAIVAASVQPHPLGCVCWISRGSLVFSYWPFITLITMCIGEGHIVQFRCSLGSYPLGYIWDGQLYLSSCEVNVQYEALQIVPRMKDRAPAVYGSLWHSSSARLLIRVDIHRDVLRAHIQSSRLWAFTFQFSPPPILPHPYKLAPMSKYCTKCSARYCLYIHRLAGNSRAYIAQIHC